MTFKTYRTVLSIFFAAIALLVGAGICMALLREGLQGNVLLGTVILMALCAGFYGVNRYFDKQVVDVSFEGAWVQFAFLDATQCRLPVESVTEIDEGPYQYVFRTDKGLKLRSQKYYTPMEQMNNQVVLKGKVSPWLFPNAVFRQ